MPCLSIVLYPTPVPGVPTAYDILITGMTTTGEIETISMKDVAPEDVSTDVETALEGKNTEWNLGYEEP